MSCCELSYYSEIILRYYLVHLKLFLLLMCFADFDSLCSRNRCEGAVVGGILTQMKSMRYACE